jgi:aminotransferase EvaB
MKVDFSYLDRQFAELKPYFSDLEAFVKTGDFTLGAPLREFEAGFAAFCGMPFAVGVGTGTDAITMSLKVMGVGPGDEVITTPTTFIATVGAIAMTGARPVFVDSEDGFVIDPAKIETAITERTKAIVPVHYTGNVADMPAIADIARKRNLFIVEDACQSIGATLDGMPVGSWGTTACFSLHPLKNLNVWGDGGVIVTRSEELAQRLRLFRNHGLVGRDEVEIFGCNSRLDTLQAVIGNRLMKEVDFITAQRIANAKFYDAAFSQMPDRVFVPTRRPGVKHVFHLYVLRVKNRDGLLSCLQRSEIDARIHYPIPVHLQKAAQYLGYKAGDFPVSEHDCKSIVTLPAHQHLSKDELGFVVDKVAEFYRGR